MGGDIFNALKPLVEMATEVVRVPTSAKETDVGFAAQKVPQ